MFDGQFYPFQPIQFMEGLLAPIIGSGAAGPVTTVSLFSTTTSTGTTIAWPASLQAGDVAVLVDRAATVSGSPPPSVVPTGFTGLTDDQTTQGIGQVSQRLVNSWRLLDGSESGNITGLNGTGGKVLYIIRGDNPIVGVTPSVWNHQATTGDPTSQSVLASGQATPLAVIGAAVGSAGSAAFSTASPAFDATQTAGTGAPLIAGYKLYNSLPANHTIDMADLGINALASGYLRFT